MNATKITHNGKIGVHRRFVVWSGDVPVGSIDRQTRAHWKLRDAGYRTVGTAATSDEAVAKARALAWLSPLEVHGEMVLQSIAGRRRWAENHFAEKLADTLRAIVAGSNSARAEADALLERIDAIAKERDAEIAAMQYQPSGLWPIPKLPDETNRVRIAFGENPFPAT